MNTDIVRIVVEPMGDDLPGLFHNTRVMVGDVALDGVHNIRLECGIDGIWIADIRCEAGPLDIAALVQPPSQAPALIVAGIDTQEDRIEVQIQGWGAGSPPPPPAPPPKRVMREGGPFEGVVARGRRVVQRWWRTA